MTEIEQTVLDAIVDRIREINADIAHYEAVNRGIQSMARSRGGCPFARGKIVSTDHLIAIRTRDSAMTELILAEPTTLAPAEQMAIIGQIANQHAAGATFADYTSRKAPNTNQGPRL